MKFTRYELKETLHYMRHLCNKLHMIGFLYFREMKQEEFLK
jgi:hypothetical protein